MKSYDYKAITFEGEVYCLSCLEKSYSRSSLSYDAEDEGIYPIFADSEWDSYPVCTVCGKEHDYVVLLHERVILDSEGQDSQNNQWIEIEIDPYARECECEGEECDPDECSRFFEVCCICQEKIYDNAWICLDGGEVVCARHIETR